MNFYQDKIRTIAAKAGHVGSNPAHIEAWMRLEHGTLDGLSQKEFEMEVLTAIECCKVAGEEQSEHLAQSFGIKSEPMQAPRPGRPVTSLIGAS